MIFTNTSFKGHWPVGSAAVIIADSKHEAKRILRKELVKQGLGKDSKKWRDEDFKIVDPMIKGAWILVNGNY